jgi:peptidoglycan/LPS O-acetylase OafA/YrhL
MTEQTVAVDVPESRQRAESGITLVVAVAVCLAVYSYLGALWCNRHGYTPHELAIVRTWVNRPLALGQDFGLLAIALLLVAGGCLVAGIALDQRQRSAPPRLLARWYPPVLVTVVLGALVLHFGGQPLTSGTLPPHWHVTGYLANLLLADRVTGPASLVALAWAPAVGALYAVTLLLARACCGGRWLPALLVRVAAAVVVVSTAADGTGAYHRFGLLTALVTVPLSGELIRLVRAGKLTAAMGTGTGAVLLGTLIWADQNYRELIGWYTPMAMLYAVLLVLLAVTSGGGVLARLGVTRWLASRGYWLFLLIGPLGYPALTLLYHQRITLPLAYLVAVPITLAGAEAGYRLTGLAARLVRRRA